jgi:hypothetical protein
VREKHCWMAADSPDKSKRTGWRFKEVLGEGGGREREWAAVDKWEWRRVGQTSANDFILPDLMNIFLAASNPFAFIYQQTRNPYPCTVAAYLFFPMGHQVVVCVRNYKVRFRTKLQHVA